MQLHCTAHIMPNILLPLLPPATRCRALTAGVFTLNPAIHPSIHSLTHPDICPAIHPSIHSFTHPVICPAIHLHITQHEEGPGSYPGFVELRKQTLELRMEVEGLAGRLAEQRARFAELSGGVKVRIRLVHLLMRLRRAFLLRVGCHLGALRASSSRRNAS